MKALTTMMMAMCLTLSLSACEANTQENEPVIPETPQNPDEEDDDNTSNNEKRTSVTLTIGETVLDA